MLCKYVESRQNSNFENVKKAKPAYYFLPRGSFSTPHKKIGLYIYHKHSA